MKNLIIATAAILALGTSTAMAADLTDRLSWDTEITTTYNITQKKLTSELETGLSYELVTDVSAYGMVYVDVKETKFTGSEFGLMYTPSQIEPLTASAYVTLDKDFKNSEFFVEVVLKF
jgi:hypothetical protein